ISHPPPITGQNFPADFCLTWSAGSHKIQLPKVFGGVAIPSNLILPSKHPPGRTGEGMLPLGGEHFYLWGRPPGLRGSSRTRSSVSEARHRRAMLALLN